MKLFTVVIVLAATMSMVVKSSPTSRLQMLNRRQLQGETSSSWMSQWPGMHRRHIVCQVLRLLFGGQK
ncbi:unnamed protein product [Rhizoctonia solani]|uniref:Uncharacterized protein n=1 Tax=Rhizoctonia solani TaxID=456999 RepID=A0A8H3DK60_9AGAM|nr:unnamed protein product [Rhizoctonia solani]